jgi:hypothetical protein
MNKRYTTQILSIVPNKTVTNNADNSHINNILDSCRAVDYNGDTAYFCSDLEKTLPSLKKSIKQLKDSNATIKVQVSAVPEGQTNRLGTVQNRFIVRKKDLLPLISAKEVVTSTSEEIQEFKFEQAANKAEAVKFKEAKILEPLDPLMIDLEKVKSLTRQAKELTPEEKIKKHINWIVQNRAVEKQNKHKAEGKNVDIGACRSQAYRELYTAFDKVLADMLAERGQTLEDVGFGKKQKGYMDLVMNKGYIVMLQEVARGLFNVE